MGNGNPKGRERELMSGRYGFIIMRLTANNGSLSLIIRYWRLVVA